MTTVELAQALHELVAELDAAAEELLQREFALTHSQLSFLMPLLERGALDVSTLAAANDVSQAAVSKRVAWFVDRDLVTSTHPAGDGKRVLLSLTPRGRRLAKKASNRLLTRLDELLAAWPEDRRTTLQLLVVDVTETVRAGREVQ